MTLKKFCNEYDLEIPPNISEEIVDMDTRSICGQDILSVLHKMAAFQNALPDVKLLKPHLYKKIEEIAWRQISTLYHG